MTLNDYKFHRNHDGWTWTAERVGQPGNKDRPNRLILDFSDLVGGMDTLYEIVDIALAELATDMGRAKERARIENFDD
jgi:hypothetical protein